jgi:hypothetical protein
MNYAQQTVNYWRAAFLGTAIFLAAFFVLMMLLVKYGYIPPGF